MAITAPEKTAIETIPGGTVNDTDSAAITSADAAPVTAPEGPDTATPGADPTAGGDARVAAVWAALNAEPGASATMIGVAADLSRIAAGKILNQLEADGRARREQGTNNGQTKGRAADRWYLITADTGDTAEPAEPTDTADASAPATEMPDVASAAITAPDADTPEGDAVSASDEEALPAAIVSAAPDSADESNDEVDLIEGAAGQPEGLIADEAAGRGTDGVDGEPVSVADADASEPVSEPVVDDPAWARARAELMELVDLFGGAVAAKDRGNAVMALGCLEMAMTKVTSVHRSARAVLTGTAAPARPVSAARSGAVSGAGAGGVVRPGALRDLVHAHLIEFPDKDFTPHEIGRVLDRSSGAVANALDRLVHLGDAVLTCERPRRFALAPTANPTPTGVTADPAAHGAPDDADGEGDTYGD